MNYELRIFSYLCSDYEVQIHFYTIVSRADDDSCIGTAKDPKGHKSGDGT